MTANLRSLLGAALIFYLVAVVNDAAAMYVLSAVAVAVLLVCFFLTRLTIRGVSFDFAVPVLRGLPGTPMAGAVTVRNAGALRRPGLSFEALLQNHTLPHASIPISYPFPALEPRSITEWHVQWWPPHRGHYTVRHARLVASDPLGIFRRGTRPAEGASFWVLPKTVDLREAMPLEMLFAMVPSAVGLSQRGGAEFLGVRPHQPGDDLRQVHWKLTAHTGELLVREYRLQPELTITLWLDLTEASYPEVAHGRLERAELAVGAAASVIQAVAGHDLAFSLAGPGLPEDLSLPSRGEAAAQRCLMALAEARAHATQTFPAWCAEATPKCTCAAVLFVVSPALHHAAADMAPLVERGVRIIGLCPTETLGALRAESHPRQGHLLRRRGRRREQQQAATPHPVPQRDSPPPDELIATIGWASFDGLEALPLALARALEQQTVRALR